MDLDLSAVAEAPVALVAHVAADSFRQWAWASEYWRSFNSSVCFNKAWSLLKQDLDLSAAADSGHGPQSTGSLHVCDNVLPLSRTISRPARRDIAYTMVHMFIIRIFSILFPARRDIARSRRLRSQTGRPHH